MHKNETTVVNVEIPAIWISGKTISKAGGPVWSYAYTNNAANQRVAVTNAEGNRLARMYASGTAVTAGAPNAELRFGYDWEGRRVSKVVSNKVGAVWQLQSSRKFLYDGWNLVGEVNQSNVLERTHVWGLDASGTMQGLPGESGFGLSSGAGGLPREIRRLGHVCRLNLSDLCRSCSCGGDHFISRGEGGLLATIIHTGAGAGVYFPMYDGNWNVMGYVRAGDGTVVAQYEYGPFGELVRATGPLAREFNFLFSTKYFDWETGLYYYGYRYYNPTIGRWLSRDPINELGFNLLIKRQNPFSLDEERNLYTFVSNNPVSFTDPDGLKKKGSIAMLIGILTGCGKGPKAPGIPNLSANCAKDPDVKLSYHKLLNCDSDSGDGNAECSTLCACLAQDQGIAATACWKKCTDAYAKRCP